MALILVAGAALLAAAIAWSAEKMNDETKPQPTFRAMLDTILLVVDLKGIPAPLVKTVAILETGNGKETGLSIHHNLFNIHAVGNPNAYWNGNGFKVGSEMLRLYTSYENSVKDFVRLISQVERYSNAFQLARVNNGPGFFLALEQAGYADTKGYAESLLRVYRSL